jgi:hypothetical protein
VGHAEFAAAGPVDGPLVVGYAGRDALVDHRDDPGRCLRPSPRIAAYLLRARGRLVRERADIIATSAQPPSAYVRRFSVDSVVFDPAALQLLVRVLGSSQVMVGSDYPYPLGERPAGGVVHRATFLDEKQRQEILRENAVRFLGD